MTRIARLLATMTLEEKIGQLNMVAGAATVTGPGGQPALEEGVCNGHIGSVLNVWGAEQALALQRWAVERSRLNIPLLLSLDVLHGHRTVFPVPLAEVGLFDPETWEQTARAAAVEAAHDGIALTFAPMLDVCREPRWGRIVESPGEDPWVAARFAVAKVRGFQGSDARAATSLAATAKHLCAYGAVTGGREYAPVDVDERSIRELYLPPFAAAVRAGALAVMPALTDINGIPMTAHAALLHGWLRTELGFDGVIVSDYNAVAELCRHGVAADGVEAATLALKAGVDIDMASGTYVRCLPRALERGLVTLRDVEASVRRVLLLKERLGLFDEPYGRGSTSELSATPARTLARHTARRAIVLLTHRRKSLPLDPQIPRLALIGPLAAARDEMLGPWAGAGVPDEAVSVLEGLTEALPRCQIDCVAAVTIDGKGASDIAAAVQACRAAELTVLCVGESASMSGEAASRASLGLPGEQRALTEAVLAVGKPVVVLLFSGRPLALPWLWDRAAAVLATWFLGTEAGHAIADVLTGRSSPSAKLPVSWPRHSGQVPIFYGQRSSGRPSGEATRYASGYLDVPATTQFPFGHGLSYASFVLGELECSSPVVGPGGELEIAVSVRNETDVAGEATVFLFIRDMVSSVARPVLELRGIQKAALDRHECTRVSWKLPAQALAPVGCGPQAVLEPGQFEIHVGQSADPTAFLSTSVELVARD